MLKIIRSIHVNCQQSLLFCCF